jgi:hypothetical protein
MQSRHRQQGQGTDRPVGLAQGLPRSKQVSLYMLDVQMSCQHAQLQLSIAASAVWRQLSQPRDNPESDKRTASAGINRFSR